MVGKDDKPFCQSWVINPLTAVASSSAVISTTHSWTLILTVNLDLVLVMLGKKCFLAVVIKRVAPHSLRSYFPWCQMWKVSIPLLPSLQSHLHEQQGTLAPVCQGKMKLYCTRKLLSIGNFQTHPAFNTS